jgi:hypothetical protein
VYTTCGGDELGNTSLGPGKHTVRMEAKLDTLTLATPEAFDGALCLVLATLLFRRRRHLAAQ